MLFSGKSTLDMIIPNTSLINVVSYLQVASADIATVAKTIDRGFIPVCPMFFFRYCAQDAKLQTS